MFSPSQLLTTLGGIAHGARLQEYGCTRRQLADAVRHSLIIRLRPGVFALPSLDPRIVDAALHGGALTCAEALRAHGIWTLPPPTDDVHVWLGASGRRFDHPGCRCTAHYSPGRAGLGLASVATALIHVFRCLEPEAFFAAYESAWNQRKLTAADRQRIRAELPKTAAWMLDLARADAQSGLESLLRFRLHLLGFALESQVVIHGVGRVDFVIGGRLILEADGAENHEGGRRHADLMRDAAASALGYETLRFDYRMLVHDWPTVVAAILPALSRAHA